jgi:hypothetical protein
MAVTPTTLQKIINQVRFRTNTENSQIVTDAELTGYINDSLAELDGVLVNKYDDYKLKNTVLTPNASGQLTLPADFLKLRGVDAQLATGDPDAYLPIREYNFQQRVRKPYLLAQGTGFGPSVVEYRLQDQYVQLEPVAVAVQYSYRVWYTPDYVPLVNPGDTLQTYMDSQAWYDFAVADVGVKVLAKQDLDPATFMVQRDKKLDFILRMSAPKRDTGEPHAVVDTRYWDSNGGGYGWGW